ncbi:hypothetical protein [Shimwellia blattae]|uniref:Uncharacterized protein n=1 Tax=Shimwellia blattae (strain ATCC 29907 / DSM 4481 / JCM 1650 / NBRC 105725 / CDC 9005-74) TaxID=630626 RepID=I2BDR2_SHIBC|nr:hypothetical protein [Shimwellia blattae]AFJ48666.1 hypothetical protein EBL_c36140 [Shimwellia blattae DSM 4481 = NBRC 105725]GAB81299.1 hypothetical protein EB105725_13_00350 [Shimwellia blattae DSM 4481 = NBRC 105725]VDY66155.1 Uncharacterised protein [Shimwellia blattae]VEC27138.1 Uncharacterised protein [Shimwellia blattae]
MIFRTIVVFLVMVSFASYAFEKCPANSTKCFTTTPDKIKYIWGKEEKDKQSRVLLNGVEIFKNDSSQIGWDQDGWFYSDDKKTGGMSKFVVYYDFNTPQYITTDPKYGDLYRYRAYRIFDFSDDNVVVSNEFYPPADYDAPIKWVSWGQKNAVIAFDDGSRFKYENGHVSMIDNGSESERN